MSQKVAKSTPANTPQAVPASTSRDTRSSARAKRARPEESDEEQEAKAAEAANKKEAKAKETAEKKGAAAKAKAETEARAANEAEKAIAEALTLAQDDEEGNRASSTRDKGAGKAGEVVGMMQALAKRAKAPTVSGGDRAGFLSSPPKGVGRAKFDTFMDATLLFRDKHTKFEDAVETKLTDDEDVMWLVAAGDEENSFAFYRVQGKRLVLFVRAPALSKYPEEIAFQDGDEGFGISVEAVHAMLSDPRLTDVRYEVPEDEDEAEVIFSGQTTGRGPAEDSTVIKQRVKSSLAGRGMPLQAFMALSDQLVRHTESAATTVARLKVAHRPSSNGASLAQRWGVPGEMRSVVITSTTEDDILQFPKGFVMTPEKLAPLDHYVGTDEAARRALTLGTAGEWVPKEIVWTFPLITKVLMNYGAVLDAAIGFHPKIAEALKARFLTRVAFLAARVGSRINRISPRLSQAIALLFDHIMMGMEQLHTDLMAGDCASTTGVIRRVGKIADFDEEGQLKWDLEAIMAASDPTEVVKLHKSGDKKDTTDKGGKKSGEDKRKAMHCAFYFSTAGCQTKDCIFLHKPEKLTAAQVGAIRARCAAAKKNKNDKVGDLVIKPATA